MALLPISYATRTTELIGEVLERVAAAGAALDFSGVASVKRHRPIFGQRRVARVDEAFAFQALAITEAAYGPEHPDVAIRRNNLGLVLQALGQLAAARAEFERALAITEATYGPEHPDIVTYDDGDA